MLSKYGDFVWDCVAERLNAWNHYGDLIFEMGPEEMVKRGLCDVVKAFVKDEPHKRSKVAEGRVRIIASVSLVDQIIERLLHRIQNLNEIEVWPTCPSKPGLGLHDDGLLVLSNNIQDLLNINGKIDCSDVSAWDWTVQEWELKLDMEVRILLARSRTDSLFAHFCRVNAHCVSRSVFVDSDGFMWAQRGVFGGQLSGRYCTSSSNSRMRVIASMVVRKKLLGDAFVTDKVGDKHIGIISMGDDSVEVHFPGLQEGLNALGHECKLVDTFNELKGVEFCSQVFDGQGYAYPASPAKTTYRFLSRKPSEESYGDLWAQLAWYLRHLSSDEKGIISKLANARVELARKLNGNSSTKSEET